ncbi:hypothetical protein I8J29_28280 [Paenibacillus sp. MWE-103]|uniref:Vegetative protein n=1 Tax=Paenibacillus artemisiicola TaxID=1172618 RepID=A0ABS3WIE2_9BACL|nr:hypothetical protein [Paenibacillus artemisiicola]MBO7748096.1 hypothetical protein [Paenibacillus artemisiicola]SFI74527.1 hypothetical protein SAMN02799624_01984 [Paenibacillus sp. UNC496MF]
MELCTVDACRKPVKAKRMCAMHHQRWRRHGDPGVTKVRRAAEPTPCKWVNCAKPSLSKGYCSKHYYIHRTRAKARPEA